MIKSKYEFIPEIGEYVNTLRLDKSVETIRFYLAAIDRFFNHLNIKSLEDINNITSTNCREYQAKLKEDKLQASSINGHFRALKALLYWLIENEYIKNNALEKVKAIKENRKEAAYMSEEEIDKFFAHCKNIEEKAMFALFLRLGLRREELASLKVQNVSDYVIMVTGKGQKVRSVAMPDDAYEIFQEYMKYRNEKYGNTIDYVFVSSWNKKYEGESILLKFKTIMKRAEFSEQRIKELHTHSLRHTFMANFMETGDIYVAQKILGHSDLSTTSKIYAHIRDSGVVNAMRNQRRIINNEL